MHFFGCLALIEEISAPFTAFGWMLQKAGLEASIYYILNQVALLVAWVVLRIGCDVICESTIVAYRWDMIAAFHPSVGFFGFVAALFMVAGNLILVFFLNPYWFYKKFQQLTRAIRERNRILRGEPDPISDNKRKSQHHYVHHPSHSKKHH